MDRKTFDALMLTKSPAMQRLVKELLANFRPPDDDDWPRRYPRRGPRPPRPAPNIKDMVEQIKREALAGANAHFEKVQGR